MASLVTRAGAWCNGEVAYLAWSTAAPIEGCLGFMVTRVHETGGDAGKRRILPTWIAFEDQSNPRWLDQDSAVWPIQAFEWRDLTLRKSRDTTAVRPIDFTVHYEIVPVGVDGPGRTPAKPGALYEDPPGTPRYAGTPRPLFAIGEPFVTPSMAVTHRYGGAGISIEATFTNGILSTQNLLGQLRSTAGRAPDADLDSTEGLLGILRAEIKKADSPIRSFLTGDALSFLRRLLDRAATEGGGVHLALYELNDPELVGLLADGVRAKRVRLILSTAGQHKPKPTDEDDGPQTVWDTENDAARRELRAIDPDAVTDRMFNNSAHIGHDKFAVYVKDGTARAVMTGSTNWTSTGLCTQSNNAIIIEDGEIARIYLDFWRRLLADPQPPRVPATAADGTPGAEASQGAQGKALRASNAAPFRAAPLGDGTSVTAWFSPNTRTASKPSGSREDAVPGDLAEVYRLMDGAKGAVLFLSFLPGESGRDCFIEEAVKLAESRPDLVVLGAVSDPKALPGYEPRSRGGPAVPPTVWWPKGDRSRIAFVRATAIRTAVGDLHPELPSAGRAIIHDKIIVVDPLDADGCAVVTGSHNLGFKASRANDENMLIIRGNRALATAYAVHVLDVYDHYVTRARIEDGDAHRMDAPTPAVGHGFLRTDASWQDRFFPVPPASSLSYFLAATAPPAPPPPLDGGAAARRRKPARPAAGAERRDG